MKELIEVLVLKAGQHLSKSEAESIVQSFMVLHREALINQGVWEAIQFERVGERTSAIVSIIPMQGPSNLVDRGKLNIPSAVFDGIRDRNKIMNEEVEFVIHKLSTMDGGQLILIWSLVS